MENEEEIMAELLVQVRSCEFKEFDCSKEMERKRVKKTESVNQESTDTLVYDSSTKITIKQLK